MDMLLKDPTGLSYIDPRKSVDTEGAAIENRPLTVLASTARTATNNSGDLVNRSARGLHLIIDMTVEPGVDTVTFTIEGKDPLSAKYYTILASAALTAVATTVLKVYPGLTAAANLVASDVLPKDWRVVATHSGATTTTYSVGAQLIM
jgi:hypothetical protein